MAQQTINLGIYPNDGTGDDLRTAFKKTQENFVALSQTTNIDDGLNLGNGTGVFAQRNTTSLNLEFKPSSFIGKF